MAVAQRTAHIAGRAAWQVELPPALSLGVIYLAVALTVRLLFAGATAPTVPFAPETGVAFGILLRRGRTSFADAAALLSAELLLNSLLPAGAGVSPAWYGAAAIRALCGPVVVWALGRAGMLSAIGDSVREYLGFLVAGVLLPAVAVTAVIRLLGGDVRFAAVEALAVGTGTLLCAPAVAFAPRRLVARLRAGFAARHGLELVAGVALAALALALHATLPAMLVCGIVLVWSALRLGLAPTTLLAALFWLEALILARAAGVSPDGATATILAFGHDLAPLALMAGLLAVAVDQERRLTGCALARARELEAVLRALPDQVLRLDPTGRVVDCRAGTPATVGLAPEAVLGQPIVGFLPEPVRAVFLQAMARARCSPEVVPLVYTLMDRGEGRRHFEARLSAIEDGHLVVVIRDVTGQARAEAALRPRARALARSNAELQQFAYIASHDLQEPLRTIAGFCELLERRYGDRLDETGREFVRFAVDGARRMQSLVRDLLDLSRVTTRGRPFEPVDCRRIVGQVVADLRGALDEASGRVELGPLPEVRADGAQLAQLFANLLGNALKYRGKAPPVVRIWAERCGDGWLFHVADNGIGIDPAFHRQIFEAFRRLHTRDEYPGNGIGLAICKKIVDRHGGWIDVRSEPGRGSDFRFWLPDDPQDAGLWGLHPGDPGARGGEGGDGQPDGGAGLIDGAMLPDWPGISASRDMPGLGPAGSDRQPPISNGQFDL